MKATLTARSYTHPYTRETYPLVEISTAGGCDAPQDGDTVAIDGVSYYFEKDPAAEMDGLFAQAIGEDYGGNVVHGPRLAPASLAGIAYAGRGHPLRVGFRQQVYFASVRLVR